MLGGPEELSARLDVEVDTPSSLISLSSVGLRASVGTARLHAPGDLDVSTAHFLKYIRSHSFFGHLLCPVYPVLPSKSLWTFSWDLA